MNSEACLLALRKLIYDNRTSLINGFTHQGVARSIKTITVSVRVPPVSYYHILIQLRRVDERTARPGTNVAKPTSAAQYHLTIHVADAAFPQQSSGEENVYERMTLDFRTLCDRIAALLRVSNYISADSPYNEPRFNLLRATGADRDVRITNLDHNWRDDEGNAVGSILYSTIEFVLEEKC